MWVPAPGPVKPLGPRWATRQISPPEPRRVAWKITFQAISESQRFAWKLRITVILESSTFKNIIVWSTIHLLYRSYIYIIYNIYIYNNIIYIYYMYVHYPHYIWSILICSQLLSFGSRRSRYVEVLITGKDVVSLLMGIPRKTLTSLKKLKNDEKLMIKPLTHWQFPSPKTCLKIEESCETKAVKTIICFG